MVVTQQLWNQEVVLYLCYTSPNGVCTLSAQGLKEECRQVRGEEGGCAMGPGLLLSMELGASFRQLEEVFRSWKVDACVSFGEGKKKKNPSHLSHESTTLVMLVESDTEKHHRYSSKLFLLWGGLLGWLSSSSEVFPVWFSQIRWKKLSVRERSALRHAFPKWRKSVLIVSTFILGETLLLGIHSQIVCSLPCNVQLLEIFSVTVLIY